MLASTDCPNASCSYLLPGGTRPLFAVIPCGGLHTDKRDLRRSTISGNRARVNS
jgi:hypothetical protein